MNYTITAINHETADEFHTISLCPRCHKHFILDSVFDCDDTDTAFMYQPMCTICRMRYSPLYCFGPSFFDGFADNMTGQLIDACTFDTAETPVFSDAAVIKMYNKLNPPVTPIDYINHYDDFDYIDSSCIPFFPSNYNPNDPEFTGEYEGPAYDFNSDNIPW